MMNLIRHLPAATLAMTLIGCGRAHHRVQIAAPAAPAPSAEAPATVKTTTVSSTNAKPARPNYSILAADGKCGDRLVKAYEREAMLRAELVKSLRKSIKGYELMKKFPNVNVLGVSYKSRLVQVREGYEFLTAAVKPFEDQYADFTICERRDGVVLLHAELNAEVAQMTALVSALEPTPKKQTN